MVVFSRVLRCMDEAGIIRDFKVRSVGGDEICVYHLLFANDTILFCDTSIEQFLHIRMLLTCFTAVIGLKINVSKSEMVPVGEVNNLDELANVLGCKIGVLPLTYLDMPLGASYKLSSIWNLVLEKLEKHLAVWKKMYLSMGDHLTLLKSMLSSIPTYFLSLITIPTGWLIGLRSYWDFLCGGLVDEHKLHLVGCDKVCYPFVNGGLGIRKIGGLGIRKITTSNKALLSCVILLLMVGWGLGNLLPLIKLF